MIYRILFLSLVIFAAAPVKAADSSKKEDSFFVKNWKKIKKVNKGTLLISAALGVVVVKLVMNRVNDANLKKAQEQERLKDFGPSFDKEMVQKIQKRLVAFDELARQRIKEQLIQRDENGNLVTDKDGHRVIADCTICFERMNMAMKSPRILDCSHVFCNHCIGQLPVKRCPQCREPITS
jgi:hypothetical protein